MTDMQVIQNFLEGVQESGKTTTAYDTTAEVIRVDENSVWVHIPGGVAETPVARTINAKKGDVVQVRVSGGTAFIVGNATAPPTDDATAIVAQGTADEAKETADVAKEVADAAAAQVQTVRNYFWHDTAGAHVSTVEGDATTGNNVLIDSDSMDIRNGETVLSSYSADGMVVYAKDSGTQIEISHLGYALGQSASGTMEKAPYYTFGVRKADSVIGNYSVAEGKYVVASGAYSHAEGYRAEATYYYAHAEGHYTTASGDASHAEGSSTTASGHCSHAEGSLATASNNNSHAEGYDTTASGSTSHAEGANTTASGSHSHAAGFNTIAGYTSQTVVGQCNDNQSDTLFEVGNGTAIDARSNAFQVHSNGNVALGGALKDMSGNPLLVQSTPTWTAPTYASSRGTTTYGGYYKVGRMVYVQLVCVWNGNASGGGTSDTGNNVGFITNFPQALNYCALSCINRSKGNTQVGFWVENSVNARLCWTSGALATGNTLYISGSYISAS